MYHARHGSLTQILPVAGVSATNGTVQNLAAPTMADAVTTVPSTSMNGPAPLNRWWSAARTSFFWMVFVAFALRFGWIVVAHTYKFKTLDDNFSFGWEMGRIGRSLAQGQGFSNPFSETTGPTAWEPPLYPFLIAGVFKLFGIYTHASALVLLSINSLFSALTCIPIFLIAKRCFDEKLAIWTAWLWAVMPPVMYWCTRWVWETSLAALLLALVFWLTLDLEEKRRTDSLDPVSDCSGVSQRWPTLPCWPSCPFPDCGRGTGAGSAASLRWLALRCRRWYLSPASRPGWLRNHRTLGVMSLRSNFGAELRIGNGPGADGTWREYLHPTQNVYQMRLYRQLGEIAYVAERKREALAFIREDYPRFLGLCVEALHLLLGRGSTIIGDCRTGSRKEFCFPGLVSTGLLGPGTRPAQTTAWRMAVSMADPVLSGGVLHRFPASALSSSH